MLVKVTRALDGNSISGKLAVAALAGMLVQTKPTTTANGAHVFTDSVELELATGRRGFVLERDVLNQTEHTLHQLMFQPGILTPELVNSHVSARQVQEIEVEGTGHLDASIVAGLSGGTKLTTSAGKWALITDAAAQEVAGILRGYLAPEDGGAVRVLIEVMP